MSGVGRHRIGPHCASGPMARRRPPGGQDGFALIAALVIIAVTGVLVFTTLGLSFAVSQYSNDQVARDTRTRAADGAIDVGLNVLTAEARNVAADIGSATNGAPACFLAQRDPVTGHATVDIDGQTVVLTCAPRAPDAAPVPERASNESVRVVGPGYAQRPRTVATTGLPWVEALDAAVGAGPRAAITTATNSTAGIVHAGNGPLTFSSDVTVRTAAAAVRNPVGGVVGPQQNGPALAVSGLYRQGAAGIADADQALTADCGVQSPNDSRDVRSVQITSILQAPVCDNADARALTPGAAALAVPFNWTDDELTTAKSVTLPPCTGQIIRLVPGYYDPADTRVLNSWLRTGGGCDGKVFHFQSRDPSLPANCRPELPGCVGAYYFDVDDTTTSPADARHSLVFNDPSSIVVFGNSSRWDASSTFADVLDLFPGGAVRTNDPAARPCDTNDDGVPGRITGVSVALSSRTTIDHRRGRVAICDRRSGPTPETAIWQIGALTPPWGPSLPTVATSPAADPGLSPRRVQFAGVGGVAAVGGAEAVAVASCDGTFAGGITGLRDCDNVTQATINVSTFDQSLPTVPSPIDTVELTLTGRTTNVSSSGGRLTIRVVGPAIPTGSCQLATNASANFAQTVRLTSGDCGDKLDDLRDLAGATIELVYQFTPFCRVPVGLITGYNYDSRICRASDLPRLFVDSVRLSARSSLNAGDVIRPFVVTSHPEGGDGVTGNVALFTVYGRTSIPRSNLDVVWEGVVPEEPLFVGGLVVSGIGSTVLPDGIPGLVCCTPAQPSERPVTLGGWVDVEDSAVVTATGTGPFRLSFRAGPNAANETAPIPRAASALDVQNALSAVGTLGFGNVAVTGPAGGPWRVRLTGGMTQREVLDLRAVGAGVTVQPPQGRLLAVAEAAIEDREPLVTGGYRFSKGYRVRLDSWKLCAPPTQVFTDLGAPTNMRCDPPTSGGVEAGGGP